MAMLADSLTISLLLKVSRILSSLYPTMQSRMLCFYMEKRLDTKRMTSRYYYQVSVRRYLHYTVNSIKYHILVEDMVSVQRFV